MDGTVALVIAIFAAWPLAFIGVAWVETATE
jgi:hypothetical protein